MEVPTDLPFHAEIKQETPFEIAFISDVETTTSSQTELLANNNMGMGLSTNFNNNESHEEMVDIIDNKEIALKTRQMMQEDFVECTNEVQVPTSQISQTSSRANTTRVKKFHSGQCPAQWPQAATRLLIELYKKHRNIFESPIINKKDSWKRISSLLANKGFPYPPTVCDNKFRALKYRYNLLKESNGKGTTGRRKWEFFQLMEELMSDRPFQSIKPVGFSSANYKRPTILIKKATPQTIAKFKNKNQNVSAAKSATPVSNQTFSSGRNIRIPSVHPPRERSVTTNPNSFLGKRNLNAVQVLPKTTYLPRNEGISSTVTKTEQSSKDLSNEKSCRSTVDLSGENPLPNGPPSWFVKFQEDSLKRLTKIEQLEQQKITAYEHRNMLIDQRTKVLAGISKSLERVANSVENNTNKSNTTRKDLLMTFSELFKQIEET